MTNLLTNAGFDGDFRDWNGDPLVHVAASWFPYWVRRRDSDPDWRNHRPVYRAVARAAEPARIHEGLRSQSYATDAATHTAGLMQFADVTPGQQLRLEVYGHAVSSTDAGAASSKNPTDMRMRVGLDPTGGTYPFAPQVVWSTQASPIDSYSTPFVAEAAAQSNRVTVFLHSAPAEPRARNAVYWDSASLTVLQDVSPGPGDIPPEEDIMLVLYSEHPNVGRPVSVYATSTRPLENISLSVGGPSGRVPSTFRGRSLGGRGHLWAWEFMPQREGTYAATIEADIIHAETAAIHVRATADQPPGPGEPERGSPRVQYPRTYILMPPDSDPEWLHAVVDSGVLRRTQWTMGFSADDAGVGDLDERRVLVVRPDAWPTPIVDWFNEHYPGVEIRLLEAQTPAALVVMLQALAP
ncbi:MAG: hypothetical protein ACFB51_16335 [Anaerolineae bacterium]